MCRWGYGGWPGACPTEFTLERGPIPVRAPMITASVAERVQSITGYLIERNVRRILCGVWRDRIPQGWRQSRSAGVSPASSGGVPPPRQHESRGKTLLPGWIDSHTHVSFPVSGLGCGTLPQRKVELAPDSG